MTQWLSSAPVDAHRIEYDRLASAASSGAGLRRWTRRFERACFDGRSDVCRQRLIGIKGGEINLLPGDRTPRCSTRIAAAS